MYAINETANGYDLAELLNGESGIFEAISPDGSRFQVVARSGQSITNIRPFSNKGQRHGGGSQSQTWRVRKVGELRSEQETA